MSALSLRGGAKKHGGLSATCALRQGMKHEKTLGLCATTHAKLKHETHRT